VIEVVAVCGTLSALRLRGVALLSSGVWTVEAGPWRPERHGGNRWPNAMRSHTRRSVACLSLTPRVLTPSDLQRAVTRMAHEVAERNGGLEDIVLRAIHSGIGLSNPVGSPWAERMARVLFEMEGESVPVGTLDVGLFTEMTLGYDPVLTEATTDIPVDLTGRIVVLVDDVLFTGRTVRAALNAPQRPTAGPDRSSWPSMRRPGGTGELRSSPAPTMSGRNTDPTRREEMWSSVKARLRVSIRHPWSTV